MVVTTMYEFVNTIVKLEAGAEGMEGIE